MGPNPLQAVMDGAVRQLGTITLAAQVAEIQMAQIGRHDLLGGVSSSIVREMAVPAQDALFEGPGTSGAVPHHVDVVIGFQHEHMCRPDPLQYQPRGVPEVGQEADVPRRGAQEKPYRVLRIMRNAEGLYHNVRDLETRTGSEEVAAQAGLELILERFLGRVVAVNGDAQFLAQHREALDMVRVFMRYKNCRKVLRRAADRGEALAYLAQAKAGINQHAGLFGLHIGRVAGGTAPQDSQAHRHNLP